MYWLVKKLVEYVEYFYSAVLVTKLLCWQCNLCLRGKKMRDFFLLGQLSFTWNNVCREKGSLLRFVHKFGRVACQCC